MDGEALRLTHTARYADVIGYITTEITGAVIVCVASCDAAVFAHRGFYTGASQRCLRTGVHAVCVGLTGTTKGVDLRLTYVQRVSTDVPLFAQIAFGALFYAEVGANRATV